MDSYVKRRSPMCGLKIAIIVLLLIATGCFIYYKLFYTKPFIFLTNKQTQNIKPVIKEIKTSEQKPITKEPVQPSFVADYNLPPIQNGMAPVIYTIPTKQNIVFLGIDDGAFKNQSVIDILKKNNIKASLFLSKAFISGNPDFFKQITAQGSFIEDHTIGHDTNMIKNQSYGQQKADICGMADYEEVHFGRRPTLFRPPGGAYSDIMRQAAADCGMKAVVTWIAKANGGAMQYQIGNKLRPGDVVLMHFRPEFAKDMQAFVDAEKTAGLHTELIEDAL